jgi:sigma-B regulation protein RsbU (phosphoserine phosphatase)
MSDTLQPNQPRFRLRTALVGSFLIQIMATVGLVGYLSYRNGQRAVQDLVYRLGDEVLARVEGHLQAFADTPHQFLEINLAAIETGILNLDDYATMGSLFWRQTRISEAAPYIYYGNEEGDFIGVWAQSDGVTTLRIRDASTAPFRNIIRLDGRGNLGEVTQTAEYDPRLRPWYQKAKEEGQATWSSIYGFAGQTALGMTASTPIYQETGELEGVLSVDITLADIADFLRSTQVSESGHALVMERSGAIVGSSATEDPFTGEDNQERLVALQSQEPLIREAAQVLQNRFGNFDQISGVDRFSFELEGEPHYLAVTPFQDGRGLNWLMMVVIPQSDFTAQIIENTRNTFFFSLGALGIAVLIGIYTARWVTHPILRLSEASQKVAAGDIDQHVQADSIVEVMTLADSFNSMIDQLKDAFVTLEDRVQERTQQLAEANREIKLLNQYLKADNTRMSGELNLLRKMQQLITPDSQELEAIEGLDIAGFMEPANEVGGDYYDVLYTDGILTLGIGDVTGHGLESSILMIMTQAVVRTLQEMREVDPVRFLDILNRTIYKNVQRMRTDKTLTLAVMNYSQGTLSISGQHEETLVVRQGGEVERIDTIDLGFPIGIQENITEFIGHALVHLHPGDGIVLYTDGLTEAENVEGKQYQLDRLCEVISQNWSCTAAEIRQKIIEDVRAHIGQQQVYDDITLVVLKQL